MERTRMAWNRVEWRASVNKAIYLRPRPCLQDRLYLVKGSFATPAGGLLLPGRLTTTSLYLTALHPHLVRLNATL
jgi:hypothetical protein